MDIPVEVRRLELRCAASFLVALVSCELVRRLALRRALFDAPNERSLHAVPTPRLGGVGIVVGALASAVATWSASPPDLRVLVGACVVVAALGLRDDVRPLSVAVRFPLQLLAATLLVAVVGVPPLLLAPSVVVPLPPAVTGVVLIVWIVGVLNITNFMDGMDGLAGSQLATAFGALALVLAAVAPGAAPLTAFSAGIAAASLGFLAHNAPPARMFMGDAGSTFLGYAYAGLAVLGLFRGVPLAVSALALSPFLLDGTFTLARRALRGEKVWRAHRSHLYQRAVQTGLGHREVLLVYLGWIVFAGAASLTAATDGRALLAGWAGSLAALVTVWRWVIGREGAARAAT